MEQVEWSDVQGIVRRGFGWLPQSAFVLLSVVDPIKARRWLSRLPVTSGTDAIDRDAVPVAVNVAVTFAGLQALGVGGTSPDGFSREFCEGIAPPLHPGDQVSRRSSMLGDVGPNDPHSWRWGGLATGTAPVHILLLVFSASDPSSDVDRLTGPEDQTGVTRIERLLGWLPEDKTEHFGFRDGLSQPSITGEGAGSPMHLHQTATGEFLIGYRNERGNLPVSPRLPHDPEFGRNGTYLVLRELEQNVAAFESWLDNAATGHAPRAGMAYREWLAAKMIGRWRNGAPLTRYPDHDRVSDDFGPFDADDSTRSNDFFYHAEDRAGFRCPIGSHIRRAWARDALGSDPERALLQARLHRLLRRGRLFGPAYDRDNRDAPVNAERRGLYFACLNADIASQFESVQHNWINNPKFSGLADERDPLIGERAGDSCMTVQQSPVNLRLRQLDQFVVTCGGGYFFLPGLRAIQRIAASNG